MGQHYHRTNARNYGMSDYDQEDNRTSMAEPLFSSSFPVPPRRQTPSLHDVSFQEENGAVFRSADSTKRVLAELAKKKRERMEKRRAALLFTILFFTICTLYVGSSAGSFSESNVAVDKSMMKYDEKVSEKSSLKKDNGGKSKVKTFNATETQVSNKIDITEFAGLVDPSSPNKPEETSLFWHVPRSGGTSMKNIMGQCLGLVSSSEGGRVIGTSQPTFLSIVDVNGLRYVNVDTTTIEGITEARNFGLAQSKLSDVIISPYIIDISSIFTSDFPGRAFTLLRDPIERAVSMYYYRMNIGDLPDVTLEEYAKGAGIENNWMTRFLTGQMEGELSKEKLERAKLILEQKFLIGFLDDIDESMLRFMKYNGWTFSEDDTEELNQVQCVQTLTAIGANANSMKYDMPKRGSQAFALITWQTQYDMNLYEFAQELFNKQTKKWGSKERKKKDKKKGNK